jgi:hypothetical protein
MRRSTSSLIPTARVAATPSHIKGRGGAGLRGVRSGNPPAVVMIVTVALTEFGAVTLTELGKTVHDVAVIESVHESETAPVNAPWPATLRL